jgi:hypothetical protein
MKSFARVLLHLAALTSTLLCVAVCAMWARSYWSLDHFGVSERVSPSGAAQRAWVIWSGRGALGLLVAHYTDTPAPGGQLDFAFEPSNLAGWTLPTDTPMKRLGFGYNHVDDPRQGYREAYLPHWLAALLLAAFPAVWLRHELRRRRRLAHPHLCAACGYDLRASPGRCPECGSTRDAAPAAA